MALRSLARSILVLVAVVIFGPGLAAGQHVTVTTTSGRVHSAVVDSRTDGERLWLRFGDRTTMVLRPIRWSHVASAQVGQRELSADELRAESASLATDVESEPAPPAAKRSRHDTPSDSQRAREALGLTRPVAYIELDARLAHWNADALSTGLAIDVYAVNAADQVVPVDGVLTVKLLVPRARDFNAAPHGRGRTTEVLGRWSVPVHTGAGTGPVKLPFLAQHPDRDANWAPYGRVEAELTVPGHGVFHAVEDYVRIRE